MQIEKTEGLSPTLWYIAQQLLPRTVTEQPPNSTHLTKQHSTHLCWLQTTAHSSLPTMLSPVFRIQYSQTLTVNLLTPSSSPNFIQDISAFFFPASTSPAQICLIPAPLIKGTHSSHGHFVTNIMLLSSGFISRHLQEVRKQNFRVYILVLLDCDKFDTSKSKQGSVIYSQKLLIPNQVHKNTMESGLVSQSVNNTHPTSPHLFLLEASSAATLPHFGLWHSLARSRASGLYLKDN